MKNYLYESIFVLLSRSILLNNAKPINFNIITIIKKYKNENNKVLRKLILLKVCSCNKAFFIKINLIKLLYKSSFLYIIRDKNIITSTDKKPTALFLAIALIMKFNSPTTIR